MLARLLFLATCVLVLSAQQDIPLKAPGRFIANATGLLTGELKGDASAAEWHDGRKELYLIRDSSDAMKSNLMISVVVSLQQQKPDHPDKLSSRLQIENLQTHNLRIIPLQTKLTLSGKSLLGGKFTLTSADPKAQFQLSGTFENAPVLPSLN